MVKLRKPKAIIFDILEVAMKSAFEEKFLLPYFNRKIKSYLEETWAESQTQEDINRLRAEDLLDVDLPRIPPKEADKSTICRAVAYYCYICTEKKLQPASPAFRKLKEHVYCAAYAKGHLETFVFRDFAILIQSWHYDRQIALYCIAKGSTKLPRHLLSSTDHGNLNQLIDGYIGAKTTGPLTETAAFTKILEKLELGVEDVLFLTHSRNEFIAARSANIAAIILMMHRRETDPLDSSMTRIDSFSQLQFE